MKNILTVAVMAFLLLFTSAGCDDKTVADSGTEASDVVEVSDTVTQTDTDTSVESADSVDTLPEDSAEAPEGDSEQ
jgi:hypothetical protein